MFHYKGVTRFGELSFWGLVLGSGFGIARWCIIISELSGVGREKVYYGAVW